MARWQRERTHRDEADGRPRVLPCHTDRRDLVTRPGGGCGGSAGTDWSGRVVRRGRYSALYSYIHQRADVESCLGDVSEMHG